MAKRRSKKDTFIDATRDLKHITLGSIWKDLQNGLNQIFYNSRQCMSKNRYMELYSHVYNYCTSTHHDTKCSRCTTKEKKVMFKGGAQIMGMDLYMCIKRYLESYLKILYQKASNLMDEDVLQFYNEQWKKYHLS